MEKDMYWNTIAYMVNWYSNVFSMYTGMVPIMKYKSNPNSTSTERRTLQGAKGYTGMTQLVVAQDRLHNFKISFSNYINEKLLVCRLCGTDIEIKYREKDNEKYVRNAKGHHLHRIYSRRRKKMFCRLDNGKLKFCFAISKMRVNQEEDLTTRKGSKKKRLIDMINLGLLNLTDKDKEGLTIPESLMGWSSLRLEVLLENIKLRL